MTHSDDVYEAISGEAHKDELRAALQRAQQQLAVEKRKHESFVATTYQAARDAYLATGRPKKTPPPAKDSRKKKSETALWHLTDWQCGKRTASYDMATCDLRVRRYLAKVRRILAIQRADHPVKDVHILLGGDMIENTTIFPGQMWEIEAPTFEQVFFAANVLETAIRAALEDFEHVSVTAEPGNHGQIGKRSDSVARGDNWDRVLYQIVADRFTNEDRFTFSCKDHWHQRFEIGNYKGVLVHGDEFKSYGGNLPMYGIIKKCNSWKAGVLPAFHDVYVGHFHNSNDLSMAAEGDIYMTGSTESDNEYAREFVAASSSPSQRLHFIDPEEGIVTAKYKILL